MDTPLYTQPSGGDVEPARRDRNPTLRELVYTRLRERLMLGEFGAQTRLREEHLAAELGVSRTPVRETLIRLAADGLLVRMDGGYYPVLADLAELRDLYELRITLELRGIGRAVEDVSVRHDTGELRALVSQWRWLRDEPPPADPRFVLLDEDFHLRLCRASGNPALTAALETVNARIRPVRMYDFLTADRVTATINEHLEIAELVLAGRLGEALPALHRHIGDSLEVVEQRVVRALTQMARHRGRS